MNILFSGVIITQARAMPGCVRNQAVIIEGKKKNTHTHMYITFQIINSLAPKRTDCEGFSEREKKAKYNKYIQNRNWIKSRKNIEFTTKINRLTAISQITLYLLFFY